MNGEVAQAIGLLERQLGMLGSDETLSRDHPEEGDLYRKALEDSLAILRPAEERRHQLVVRVREKSRQKIKELRAAGKSDDEICDALFGLDS